MYIDLRSDNTVSHNTADGNRRDGIAIGLAVRYDEDQNPVRDGNGELVLVEGIGRPEQHARVQSGLRNTHFDGTDASPACDNNRWRHNRFTTVNQPCVD